MDYSNLISQYSAQYNVPASILSSLIQVESGGNQYAVSSAGAEGLGQLMPATAQELGITNVFDPSQNIGGSAKYLSQLYDKYQNWHDALIAYNAGSGNLDSGKAPASSYDYASKILDMAGQKNLTKMSGDSTNTDSWVTSIINAIHIKDLLMAIGGIGLIYIAIRYGIKNE